jgi:hypothetical protein
MPVKNKTNNPNGRPKGSRNKLRATDFFNGDERDELIANAKLLAFGTEDTKPDKDMVKFLFEQLFGKATQRLAGDDQEAALTLIKVMKANDSGNQSTT